ncbi:hypothetical protein HBI24_153670 [Parastagonospora nodorum]|nr:hypothetical protein HBI09_068950 [Parastagonospora nodorum]KAH4108066.1 hypothetical protein HBH46_051330 [Parastagonospora nodorum]KAH4195835.1 hypothetical protein HBH42_077870 [Parastagonospora nodorum]KAH4204851.1 hypothetical protein HBI95_140160 [Parastagonospora nodorum]KAH4220898.1 hypothetical protein HBI06_167290 [Parastagonospora nodorum]
MQHYTGTLYQLWQSQMLTSMTEGVQKSTAAPVLGLAALGEVVAISIGIDQKIYHVHKDLICHHSEYFRAAYNGRWKEAQDGVALDFVEAEVFNLFVHWIYTTGLPGTAKDLVQIAIVKRDESSKNGALDQERELDIILLKASIFGDRFLATGFRKDVHNLFVNLAVHGRVHYECIKYAFDNLGEDVLLLECIVDLQCNFWAPEDDEPEELEARELVPSKFFIRVMTRNYEYNGGLADKGMMTCDYHRHDSDQEREACPYFRASR